jgi:hypothetical protein
MPALLKPQDVAFSPDKQEWTADRLHAALSAPICKPFARLTSSANTALVKDERRGFVVRHASMMGDDFASREWS